MKQNFLLALYRVSPRWLQSVMASGRGLELRTWRYGNETAGLIEQALERERWSPQRLEAYQQDNLSQMLHLAATTVPYYREQWRARRARGDHSSWEELNNWPILQKDEVRDNPRAFLRDGVHRSLLYYDETSGSTGRPLHLWFGRRTLRAYHGMYEARVRQWNGVSRHDWWATMGAKPVVPMSADRPPYWVKNYALNQLYLSADFVSPTTVRDIYRVLAEVRATHIFGYPSTLSYLAAQAIERGLPPPGLEVVITNAGPLFDWRRRIIQEGLNARTVETYGMTEIVTTASECEYGTLHLWPEVGHVEVFNDESPARLPAGQPGRLVCTGLLNREMPLIRYEVGDRGVLAATSERCPCLRSLPILRSVEGRTIDSLVALDGRRVFTVPRDFWGLPLVEYQVIQDARNRLRVLVVPAAVFGPSLEETIRARLRKKLGDVEVQIEQVERIPREPSGKLRMVAPRIPEGEVDEPRTL